MAILKKRPKKAPFNTDTVVFNPTKELTALDDSGNFNKNKMPEGKVFKEFGIRKSFREIPK